MQSAATLPEARELVEGFRARTMEMVLVATHRQTQAAPGAAHRDQRLARVHGRGDPRLDPARDLPRAQLRDLLIAAFGATLLAAQHIDPKVKIELA